MRRQLGTFATTATTTTEDSVTKRYVWNVNNRVARALRASDSTVSWTYSTKAWRAANGSTSNRVSVVRGLDEDVVNVTYSSCNSQVNAIWGSVGIGLDSTSTPTVYVPFTAISSGTTVYWITGTTTVPFSRSVGIGTHYLQALEYAGNGTINFSGVDTTYTSQTGLEGSAPQ